MTTVVEALTVSHPERAVFQDLRDGNVGCVTVTCGVWEDARESMDSIGKWRDSVRANADLAGIARTAQDIDALIGSGRTAVLLGFQNTDQFECRIRYIELFADFGVRVVQLTYNNQNAIGGSCYETNDSGLSRFGREVIQEMNRVGILVDLSHVGEQTALDTIEVSQQPVAVTHANPTSIYPHPRNKSDKLLKVLAEKGGVVGCAIYPNVAGGSDMSLDEWLDMVAWTVDLIGIEHVGFGSDYNLNNTQPDLNWRRMGRWTKRIDYGAGSSSAPGYNPWPSWFQSMKHYPHVVHGLRQRGFSEEDVRKIAGENWRQLYRDVFGRHETDGS